MVRSPFENNVAIESPWPNHVPILHETIDGRTGDAYNLAMRRAVRNLQNTHLVREVRVGYLADFFFAKRAAGLVGAYSRTFMENCIAKAETEFDYLETMVGLKVASHEFQIVEDGQGRLRTLARVAIIDGQDFAYRTHSHRNDNFPLVEEAVQFDLRTRLKNYRLSEAERPDVLLLADLSPQFTSDFVYGAPREATGNPAPEPYLVDIEPLLEKPRP